MSKLTSEQIKDIMRLNSEHKSYDQIAKEADVTVHDVVRLLHPNY